MNDAEEFDDERDEHPRYRDIAEIGMGDLYEALMTLAGFAENPYLAVQASQLCLVDNTLNALEQKVMRHKLDDEPEMGFTTLEFIRVALAKHEVSKKGNKKPIAFAPGLARPNRWCGSMEYELSSGGAIISYVTRRDIAETIRFIPKAEHPSVDDLAGFRAYMNPPDVEPPTR